MNNDFDFVFYLLPAILVLVVVVFFFKKFMDNEENRRRYILQKDLKRDTINMRLQAYERMVIFLERMRFEQVLSRIAIYEGQSLNEFMEAIVKIIESEYQHNISQQIYISIDSWTAIMTAKKLLIETLKQLTLDDKVKTPIDLKAILLEDAFNSKSPIQSTIDYLKKEASQLW